ncbi:MAG: anthranilate synthase component I [Bacillota bacterium]|nr:anthranilate synthase component I [Bacillota bacterium]
MAENTLYYPDLTSFKELAEDYNLIPLAREMVADFETPVSVYMKAFNNEYSCLLESVEGSAKLSRYSFIAGDPFLTLKAYGSRIEISSETGTKQKESSLVNELRLILNYYKIPGLKNLPRFFGGALGYLGYDCVRQFERLPNPPADDLNLPDAYLIFPKSVIVFDHYTSKLKIIYNTIINTNPEEAYHEATAAIEAIAETIRSSKTSGFQVVSGNGERPGTLDITSGISEHDFCDKVEKIKEHIQAGDILQAVLSQRFAAETKAPPFEVYRALRSINPSPYMYYLNYPELQIAGASPEMLVRLEDGIVENRPIAGTRPRGEDEASDMRLEEELLNDPKERAEHVMLVDLGRNDLGRVSRYGTVEVPVFMACEKYSHVMHLVSEVKGVLDQSRDALDALVAAFPAGTVSGAPKIRAMEIIDELEPTKRGPYAGAIGYFSFSGSMDTCITIRTIVFAAGRAYAQAGAGIVADSEPRKEYAETVSKAKALVKALQIAEEGSL